MQCCVVSAFPLAPSTAAAHSPVLAQSSQLADSLDAPQSHGGARSPVGVPSTRVCWVALQAGLCGRGRTRRQARQPYHPAEHPPGCAASPGLGAGYQRTAQPRAGQRFDLRERWCSPGARGNRRTTRRRSCAPRHPATRLGRAGTPCHLRGAWGASRPRLLDGQPVDNCPHADVRGVAYRDACSSRPLPNAPAPTASLLSTPQYFMIGVGFTVVGLGLYSVADWMSGGTSRTVSANSPLGRALSDPARPHAAGPHAAAKPPPSTDDWAAASAAAIAQSSAREAAARRGEGDQQRS